MQETANDFKREMRQMTLEALEKGQGTDFSFLVGAVDEKAEVILPFSPFLLRSLCTLRIRVHILQPYFFMLAISIVFSLN
jgi:hypothetical protein